jgi:hypothetical protein
LFSGADVGEPDLQEYDQFGSEQQFGTSMEVLVINYCFPKFWPKREDISRLQYTKVAKRVQMNEGFR